MAFFDEVFEGLIPVGSANIPKGMELTMTSAPTVEPVTLDELKTAMRYPLTLTQQDANLTKLLIGARLSIEALTRTLLVTQTWTQTQNAAARQLEIARKPVQSISKIEVIPNMDADTPMLVPASHYITSGIGIPEPGAMPNKGLILARSVWPTSRGWKGFIITFVGGFGDTAADVPEDLKDAVTALAVHRFENPDGSIGTVRIASAIDVYGSVPPEIFSKCARYMEWR
jgi:uncharacterized phiE125 gp8 family phage protein